MAGVHMIVDLFTFDDRLVDTVELPPYKTMPAIVLYGQRAFVLKEGTKNYYEALVAIPMAVGVTRQ